MKTVVLIPCYNEALTIKRVVEDFKMEMPHADIYVYDNNSTDGTAEIAAQAGAIVRHEKRQGKGNVVRTMFRDIDADCYIMVDGDDTYPAKFGPVLEKLVLDGDADMAIGDRLASTYFEENKRPFHNFGNVLVRNIINFLYQSNVNDIMTGARAFSREFVKSFAIMSKGFEIETEMTIFALENNFKLEEVPIVYRDRPEGSESKLNTYVDGVKVLRTVLGLFRETKPFKYFGTLGIIFILIGIIFFIPIIEAYRETGLVLRFPTLIVIVFTWIAGILMLFNGMVLEAIHKNKRQEVERYLNLLRIIDK